MRDVISNETIKEINKVIDEILTNIDDNVRNIVGAGNYSLPTIFSYTNYSGQTINVHGSTFRHEIIIDNADGNNLIGDICTVIGDRKGIKLAKAGVEDRHDTFANYWDSTIDIAYSLDNIINGYVFDMHNGYIGEGANSSSNMSFKIDGLEIGKSYTLTFTGRFARAEFVVAGDSYARICSDISATPYIASVTLEKDTVGHVYRLDFTNNTQSTTLYLNFDFLSLSYEESSYVSEFIAENLVIAGMNIGIISRYMYYNRKWYPIEAGGGTSDLDAIELTYAEYQALTPDEKTDPDKIYFITDYPASVGALNDLSDVDITTPTEGQILTYDDTDDEWKNTDVDDIAPTVTEASTRANIATGDTLKTIIGKIKKFFSDLKAVAFSGSYNDLSDKPTIPAAQVNSDWNASSGVAQILNKPTIPTVNNATLTIQKNGTNVETFTANASSNKTANITVPTKVSELTNDSGYTTNTGTVTQVKVGSTAYNPSSGVVSLPAYPVNTDTKVTSSANHYTPSTASGSDKTASASGATAAWSIDVVKGVTLNTDGKGHVTGLSVTSGKIPANPNTDTKVTQTATTTNANYEVLFSYTADDTSRTEGARKCSKIKANPSTGLLYSKGLAVDNGQVTTVYGVGTITHNNKAISLPSSAGTLALTSDNVASATKATQDSDGNTIKSTYFKFVSNTTVTSSCTAKSCTLGTVVVANMNGLVFVRFDLTVTAVAWDTGFVLPSSVKASTIGVLAWGGGAVAATAQDVYCTITTRTVTMVKNEGYGRLDNGTRYYGWLIYY